MENLSNIILKKEDWNEKVLEVFYSQSGYEDWNSSTLSKNNQDLGFLYFLNNSIEKAKQYFSNAGFIDIYLVNNFTKSHSRFLDFDLPRCLIPVLSDNEELIKKFSKIRYKTFYRKDDSEEMIPLSMDEMVAIGELPIWCNTVQFFMANDNAGVERNLNIIETKTLKSLQKKEEGLKDDYEFYKALYNSDKAKMEEVLEKLVSPKIHKKRNDNPILNQYISLPALGYAKLAWRKGIEVEVKSNLVPKELLPIVPLDNYEIPYDFLK
jgi:hypothetical protein